MIYRPRIKILGQQNIRERRYIYFYYSYLIHAQKFHFSLGFVIIDVGRRLVCIETVL